MELPCISQSIQTWGSVFLSVCTVPVASGYDLSQGFKVQCNTSKCIKSHLQYKRFRIQRQVTENVLNSRVRFAHATRATCSAWSFCCEAVLLRLKLEPAFCRWNCQCWAPFRNCRKSGRQSQWSSYGSQLLPGVLLIFSSWLPYSLLLRDTPFPFLPDTCIFISTQWTCW